MAVENMSANRVASDQLSVTIKRCRWAHIIAPRKRDLAVCFVENDPELVTELSLFFHNVIVVAGSLEMGKRIREQLGSNAAINVSVVCCEGYQLSIRAGSADLVLKEPFDAMSSRCKEARSRRLDVGGEFLKRSSDLLAPGGTAVLEFSRNRFPARTDGRDCPTRRTIDSISIKMIGRHVLDLMNRYRLLASACRLGFSRTDVFAVYPSCRQPLVIGRPREFALTARFWLRTRLRYRPLVRCFSSGFGGWLTKWFWWDSLLILQK